MLRNFLRGKDREEHIPTPEYLLRSSRLPVSYTHLDVYKRQAAEIPVKTKKFLRLNGLLIILTNPSPLSFFISVSLISFSFVLG